MKKKIFGIAYFCLMFVLSIASVFFVNSNKQNLYAQNSVMEGEISFDFPKSNNYLYDNLIFNFTDKSDGYTDFSGTLNSAYCLRDDYVIYTQNQDENGTCWAFSGNTVSETTVMKATGEFYDFSDAWVAVVLKLMSNYYSDVSSFANYETILDTGSNFTFYNFAIKHLGLMLEQDFMYDDSYFLDNDNVNYFYNFYKNYSNMQFVENLLPVRILSIENDNYVTAVKQHIIMHGALSAGFYCNLNGIVETLNYDCFKPVAHVDQNGDFIENDGHMVSIIGWDDTITYTEESNGKTHTGAWIALNSWGNNEHKDGIVYLFYDDPNFYGNFEGYIYSDEEFYDENSIHTKLVTGYDYETNLKAKYYAPYNSTKATTLQKNIILKNSDNQTFQLKYEFDATTSTTVDNVQVLYDDKDITNDFEILIDNISAQKYFTIKNKNQNINLGAYKVIINYSNGQNYEQQLHNFYIIDQLEIGTFNYFFESNDAKINTGSCFGIYNSYNICNTDLVFNTLISKTYSDLTYTSNYTFSFGIYFSPTTYSNYNTKIFFNYGDTEFQYTDFEYTYINIIDITNLYQKIDFIEIRIEFDTPLGKKDKFIKINIIYSNENMVNVFYNTNGANAHDDKQSYNLSNEIVLSEPTKTGYVFDGWYYDSKYLNKINDNKILPENILSTKISNTSDYKLAYYGTHNVSFAYAKWSAENITNTSLISNYDADDQKQGIQIPILQEFTLNFDFDHTFKDKATITWYKNDQVIEGQTGYSLTQKLTQEQKVTYKAVATIVYDNQTVTDEKEIEIEGYSTPTLNPVTDLKFDKDNKNKLIWIEPSDFVSTSSYKLTIYKKTNNGDILVGEETTTENSFTIDLNNLNITQVGEYYITVNVVNGVEYSEKTNSSSFKVYEVKIDSVSNLVIEGDKFIKPTQDPKKDGYKFESYLLNGQPYDFNTKISDNINLSTSWSLIDITNFNESQNIEQNYSGNSVNILVNPTHNSKLNNFSYQWFKIENGIHQKLDGKTTNMLTLKNVSDSGIYVCEVTLNDTTNKLSTTNESNEIKVNIKKATGVIELELEQNTFVYNKNEQYINFSPVLKINGQEVKDIIFKSALVEDINADFESAETNTAKFKDVPQNNKNLLDEEFSEGGVYFLIVSVRESENYTASNIIKEIFVKRADNQIIMQNPYQVYDYTGTQPNVQYSLKISNQEQEVYLDFECINARSEKYTGNIIASRSQNFNECSLPVIIFINPAKITVKIHSLTSILFLNKKQLSYEIVEGKLYNNDNLNIVLSSDANANKIGQYKIELDYENSNYEICIIQASYRVTSWPYIIVILTLLTIISICMYKLSKRRYIIDFEVNGGEALKPIEIKNKSKLEITSPQKKGFKFAGWYEDKNLTKKFKNSLKKGKAKTLYAKWDALVLQNENNKNNEVKMLVKQIQEKIGTPKKTITKSVNKNKFENNSLIKSNEKEVKEKEEKLTKEKQIKQLIDNVDSKQSNLTKEEIQNIINKISKK